MAEPIYHIHPSVTYLTHEFEHNYQLLPTWKKVCDYMISFFNDIIFIITQMAPHFLIYLFCSTTYFGDDCNWRPDNQGLVLFFSGLNGHPVWASPYARQIVTERPEFEVRIPHIVEKGNCSVEEALRPLTELVDDYIAHNPGKPICLIGTSYGGRLAGLVSNYLRGKQVAVRVTGIAGAFFGSSAMDILNRVGIASRLFHEEVVSGLMFGSQASCTLIDGMRLPDQEGDEFAFQFYGTPNDCHLMGGLSCFPRLDRGEQCELFPGESHISITQAVRRIELERAFAWLDAHQAL